VLFLKIKNKPAETPGAKQKNKAKTRLYMMFWVMLVTATAVTVSARAREVNRYRRLAAEVSAMIDSEKTKSARLDLSRDYYDSDLFVEKIARDQLGLVLPDERLFYNDARN
jgi:cell division protein FtsB